MKRHLKTLILLLVFSLGFSGAALAQEITASLSGTVKDANGATVSAATITITDSAKKLVVRTTTTDDQGSFTASDLNVGLYDITVEAPSFKKHIESNLKLDVGQKRSINVVLEAGNVEE